jgi:hypothetical protein
VIVTYEYDGEVYSEKTETDYLKSHFTLTAYVSTIIPNVFILVLILVLVLPPLIQALKLLVKRRSKNTGVISKSK